jgi:colicin import membrane protein
MAVINRLEFAPPPTPGLLRSLALAVLAHGLLLAALSLGVHWKREDITVSAEVELWSALPQEAAPKPMATLPEPAETGVPPPPVAPAAEPPQPDADIVLQQEKQRLKKEKQLALKREKELEQQRLEQLKQARLEKQRLQDQRDQEKQALLDKKKSAQEAKRKEALAAQQEAKQLEAMRADNLKRMMAGLPGATGAPDSKGTALHSSGPSASYGGRIRARIKPNIVFTEEIAGNPTTEVEVRTAPDGTIISRKVVKTSGNTAWNDAVIKAIDKTEKLPPDVDGRVPPSLIITFRPKD